MYLHVLKKVFYSDFCFYGFKKLICCSFLCFLWIKAACLLFMLFRRINYLDKSCLFVCFLCFFCVWDFVVKKIKSPNNLIYITTILSQSFLIITIFFHHYNLFSWLYLFPLLQSFFIITIIMHYPNLFFIITNNFPLS